MFTLVVSFVFAQLAPVTWRLAEIRIMDVVIGSMIGIVFGLLAWPRGAQEELRRAVALLLTREAETVEGTAAAVVAGTPGNPADDRPLQRALTLAESAWAQHQSEPRRPPAGAPDWQAAMMSGHHVLWGSRRLLAPAGPPLVPENASLLHDRSVAVTSRHASGSRPRDPGPAAHRTCGRGTRHGCRRGKRGCGGGRGAGCGAAAVLRRSYLDGLARHRCRTHRGSPR